MAGEAFDLAERLQTPVFVLTDLDLGMNNWMSDAFPYPTAPLDRGKVLDAAAIEKVKDTWGRYKDVDGDAIPYRTLPGTNSPAGAYFTRGSGHNEKAIYSEKATDYVNNVDRLSRKFETARTLVPKPEIQDRPGALAGVLAYGTSHYGTAEGRDKLAAESGVPLDYCRLRALPVGPEAAAWIRRHERIYVVEQNRDSQLVTILRDEFPEIAARFVPIRQYNGLPLDATTVVEGVLSDRKTSGKKG
jgi:2-oxoglutarate ferredoxin oxidoreductase subunit alpha